jgi:hypothetical protein
VDKDSERAVMAKLDSIQEGVTEIKISQAVMASEMKAIQKRQDAHDEERKEGRKVWTGFNIAILLSVVTLMIETVVRLVF